MKRILLAIGLLLGLVGCSVTATLFPVSGPMTKQSPLPVLKAKVMGVMGNTGDIKLVMPDGEVCEGKWSSIAPTSSSVAFGSATGSVSSGLNSAWGTVYGSGFTMANKAGINRGEAVMVGNRGTVVQVEFYTGSGTANGTGVALDNKGNTFKVLF